jgi:hypothetical protein
MTFSPQTTGVRSPHPTGVRGGRLSRALAASAGLALVALPALLGAQRTERVPTVPAIDSVRADGTIKQVPIAPSGGFNLFAAEDLAGATLRMAGQFRTGLINEGGPASVNQGSGPINNHIAFSPTVGSFYIFFEMGFVLGAPPHEFRKIRAVHPGVNAMAGSLGYTTHYWQVLVPPQIRKIGAADGQFGRVFSGVATAFNSSCRDDARFLREGFSLLPMLDCPETWGGGVFDGKRVIPDSVWLNTFRADPAGFRWNDWKIPTTRYDQKTFLGAQSTYGFMSDYYREQRLRYGAVVPGGTGAPTEPGYPLGIELRVDSWQFSSPAVRNVQFYQVNMVNKSRDVYGTGIDYDSLYFGFGPGFLFGGAGGQNASVYFDWSTNTMHAVKAGTSGNCSSTYPRPYTNAGIQACPTTIGFQQGVYSITWLKSPLGDVRNKLFTNPASPYYNPGSPLADDTITFNHAKANSFGQTSQNINRSMRSGFGMISSTEANYLDGRQPSDLTLANYVTLFQPEEWSGTYPPIENAKFNKFVPGNQINPKNGQPFGSWDYNNDGVQDTIYVPTCGRQGCVELWSDTIAGGFRNNFGNILNTVSAGPFPLRANDTTQFLFAFSWATDSITTRQTIAGLTESYLTNYEGPQAFAFPAVQVGRTYTIASAELVDSTRFGLADASVGAQITIRYPQINPVDPFMVRLVEKVRQDSIRGDATVRRILRLNPGLLQRLRDRANDNLAAVYVFKSCDNGATYTTTSGNAATCVSAPTRNIDNGAFAFPWRPWATVNYTGGLPATGTVSEFLQAGKSYLYSFVTRTRGYADFRIVDTSATGGFIVTDVQATLGFPLDTINSALAASGPSVIQVYAPITNSAGRSFARLDTATVSGNATQDLTFGAISNDISGTSKLVFANRFIVRKTIDTVTSATTTTINAQWVVPRGSTSPAGPVVTDFVARDQAFTVNENIPVRSGANFVTGTLRGTSGSARVFVDTVLSPNLATRARGPGYVWVTGDNRPIFAINDSRTGNNQDRDQRNSPLFPGFTVQPRDTATLNAFRREVTPGGVTRARDFILRANGDTVQAGARTFLPKVVENPTATYATMHDNGGQYVLEWLTDPWGPRAPFRLDPAAGLQAVVDASLADVASKSTTVTESSAAVGALVGATTARPLQEVKVPFKMTYKAVDGSTENVRFAMLRRSSNTRLLGSGADTVRVNIPADLWMPGDTLFALHKVERDSTVGTGATRFTVLTNDGTNQFKPIRVKVDSIGLRQFLVACEGGTAASGIRPAADATTCNPIELTTRGSSPNGGYLPVASGWKQVFELTNMFDPRSVVQLVATPFRSDNPVTKADLARVSVVPNPYIARSDIDELTGRAPTPRIYFTGVPEQGVLRIYSVSGQFLQELTWTRSDLTYSGNNAPTGDLPWNMRTREGLDIASGLYLYVLTATGPNGKDQVQRGKFVVIK